MGILTPGWPVPASMRVESASVRVMADDPPGWYSPSYGSNRSLCRAMQDWAGGDATGTFGEPIHVFHDPGVPSVKTSTCRTIGVTPDRLHLLMARAESNIWTMTLDRR